ncbi:hypothetical protein NDU88_005131 [Pleurodeles waltl]|uniref:Uncharacterized protein n=1 Tax=Pleurodeles waltl TaxID=8319 RepID=A0AAV7UJ27_PLEWA|nr:hypothetical protein NDU88_005131 [Pleurodeles waltl]
MTTRVETRADRNSLPGSNALLIGLDERPVTLNRDTVRRVGESAYYYGATLLKCLHVHVARINIRVPVPYSTTEVDSSFPASQARSFVGDAAAVHDVGAGAEGAPLGVGCDAQHHNTCGLRHSGFPLLCRSRNFPATSRRRPAPVHDSRSAPNADRRVRLSMGVAPRCETGWPC